MAEEAENSNEFEINMSPSFPESIHEDKKQDEVPILESESKTSEEVEGTTEPIQVGPLQTGVEPVDHEFLEGGEKPIQEIAGMTEVTHDDEEVDHSSKIPKQPKVMEDSLEPPIATRRGSRKSSELELASKIPRKSSATEMASKTKRKSAELSQIVPDGDEEFEDMNEMGPRIRPSMADEEFLAGFEIDQDVLIAFDEVQVEEEQAIVEEEEEIVALDRAPYYQRHDIADELLGVNRMRNLILQKKLSMYFKRKKMDHVTRETDWSLNQQNKYYRKLEAYGELMEFDHQVRETTNKDIEVTKAHREKKFKELTTKFQKMQNREGEIGYGLINTKTGNVIPDKHVQRLIHRQSLQMDQVCSMRLKYIKLKQMVQEKLDAIATLDEVAPGFLLADYEHLKILNQGYGDKIEEREEELVRLRAKSVSSTQFLAHIREKSAAMQNDLEYLKDTLVDTNEEVTNARWRLNCIKKQREIYRQSITKLQNECGLLTKPTLLRDMEQGLVDVKVLEANLELVMKEHKKRAMQIKTIRKKIEMANETRQFVKKLSTFRSAEKVKSIYKGRPSLLIPTIEDDAFSSLKSIKPKITYDRRRHDVRIKRNKMSEG